MMAASNADYIEVFQDVDGQWRWHARAKNHEIVAIGGEPFVIEFDARRAAQTTFPGVRIETPKAEDEKI
jgi:uncharacterized protein YegP (UPF0339 family)